MICRRCDGSTRVLDTRVTEDKKLVRRRRECTKCGYEAITYEMVVGNDKDNELKEKHKIKWRE